MENEHKGIMTLQECVDAEQSEGQADGLLSVKIERIETAIANLSKHQAKCKDVNHHRNITGQIKGLVWARDILTGS